MQWISLRVRFHQNKSEHSFLLPAESWHRAPRNRVLYGRKGPPRY